MSKENQSTNLEPYLLAEVIHQFMDFRGRTPLKLGMGWGGGNIRALSANNVQMGRIDFNKESYFGSDLLYQRWMTRGACEKGDILLTTEAPLGNVAQIPDSNRYILSQRVILLKSEKRKAESDYLFHLFQGESFQRELIKQSTGTTVVGIQQAKLARIKINLPAPVEQKKIAKILTTIDNLIEKTEALIAKYQTVKQGMMHDLFTRGVDAAGNLRPTFEDAPELYEDSAIGWIPKEWDLSNINNECSISTGFTLGPHRRPVRNKYLYLRVANVQRDCILLDDLLEIEAQEDEFLSKRLEKNDLLIVEGHANPNEIGRCALVTSAAVGLTFQNHLFRLKAKAIKSLFLCNWLNSEIVRGYWIRHCGTSSGLNTINQKMLREVPVVVPLESEQERIEDIISCYSASIKQQTDALEKLKLQKSGLMQDLLTGNVRVTISETEEPLAHV